MYEAEQELHPEQRQGHGYCQETLGVVPCCHQEDAGAAPPPRSPTQLALEFPVSAALPWGTGEAAAHGGASSSERKELKSLKQSGGSAPHSRPGARSQGRAAGHRVPCVPAEAVLLGIKPLGQIPARRMSV